MLLQVTTSDAKAALRPCKNAKQTTLGSLASTLPNDDEIAIAESNVHCLLNPRDETGAELSQSAAGSALSTTSATHALPLMYDGDVALVSAPTFALLCTPLGADRKELVWAETSEVWKEAGTWVLDKIVAILKKRQEKIKRARARPTPNSIDDVLLAFDFRSVTPAMCRLVAAATTAAIGD
ncbi:uncharacterized protein JCM15063_004573 [Sporobolomyces koalae]|uniref:uncharacterized protein n=1 Tax=Sporobolomyces koalae TaxID=500713 RepID=UPI00317E0C44